MSAPTLTRKILDGFYYLRKRIVTSIAYASLRIYGSEVRWRDLWNQAFPPSEPVQYDLTKAKCLDLLFDEAKEAVAVGEARRSVVTDKCKTLLTASSLLIAAIGVLLPKALVFSGKWMQILFFLSAIALLNAVVLLLEFFNVRAATVVSYDQSDIELPPDDFKKGAIHAYFATRAAIDSGTDYLAEIYKAARFSFLTAFTLIVMVFSVTFFWNSADREAELVARQMKADPVLLKSLRGEKGDTGPAGDRGPRGERGPDGKQGPPGLVDEDSIVTRILKDPRLRSTPEPTPMP